MAAGSRGLPTTSGKQSVESSPRWPWARRSTAPPAPAEPTTLAPSTCELELCDVVPFEAVEQTAPRSADPDDNELWERWLRMGAFVGLLLLQYVVTRMIAQAGLPSDGRRVWLGGDLAADLGHLMEGGVAIGWLVGIDSARRRAWFCASPQRTLALLLIFVATSPVFSAIGLAPGLQVSMANVYAWGATAWGVLAVGATAGGAVLLWHLVLARKTLSRRAFAAYLMRQACIVGFYAAAVGAAQSAHARDLDLREAHLHHLYIGLVIASFAQFDSFVSAALLAIGTGLFVHGIGAYGWAPLVKSGCRWSDEISAPSSYVRLNVCPADVVAMAQSQFMKCPSRKSG